MTRINRTRRHARTSMREMVRSIYLGVWNHLHTQAEKVTNCRRQFFTFSLLCQPRIPSLCVKRWKTRGNRNRHRQRKTETSSSNGFSHVNSAAVLFFLLFLLIKSNGFKCRKKNSRRNEIYYFSHFQTIASDGIVFRFFFRLFFILIQSRTTSACALLFEHTHDDKRSEKKNRNSINLILSE